MVSFLELLVFDQEGNCIVKVADETYHGIPENFLWNEVKRQLEKSPYGPIFTDVTPGNTKMKLTLKECEHPFAKIMGTDQLSPMPHVIVATALVKEKDNNIKNDLFKVIKEFQKKKGQITLADYEPLLLKICNKPANSNVQMGQVKF